MTNNLIEEITKIMLPLAAQVTLLSRENTTGSHADHNFLTVNIYETRPEITYLRVW